MCIIYKQIKGATCLNIFLLMVIHGDKGLEAAILSVKGDNQTQSRSWSLRKKRMGISTGELWEPRSSELLNYPGSE